MPSRRKRSSRRLMVKAAELAFAVPQVVAHRVTRMAIAGPSPTRRDRNEFQRMGIEKAAAFAESWNAMAMEAIRANQALSTSLWRSLWLPWLGGKPSLFPAADLHDAAIGILGKGVAPVHRRAVANARRLGRTRLR